MARIETAGRRDARVGFLFTRVVIVALTLTTAAVHQSLGGLLFLMNAIGYTGLAIAMVLPGPFASIRWLVRLALLGFTAATIGGWVLFGARFELAYIDKAVEVVLVTFLLVELWLVDGGPAGILEQGHACIAAVLRVVAGRS